MKESCLLKVITESFQKIGAPRSVLVGISGGADSVALLYLLLQLRESRGICVSCVHVNHGLRPESLYEEEAVQLLCNSWKTPLVTKRVYVSEHGSREANARTARYQAFEEAMEETGAEVLALAHHMDDQAETVLMRLLYGAGGQGLAAMRELNSSVWRPLLVVSRADLLDLLQCKDIGYVVDTSNMDVSHLRNRIRLDVIPQLLSIAPGCVQALARTAVILGDEHSYWKEVSREWLAQHGRINTGSGFVMLDNLLCAPVALQRHVIRSLCAAVGVTPEFAHVEQVINLAQGAGPRKANLPGAVYAYRGFARLHIVRPEIPDLQAFGKLIDADDSFDRKAESFDKSFLEGATLRTRKSGDYIVPLGAGGRQKLREYMINRKIDQPLRDQWPLLAKGNEVLWVVGVGISQTAAVSKTTKSVRRIRYVGKLPDEVEYQAK
jgi:tRNA(Ile)-lysidine synthase